MWFGTLNGLVRYDGYQLKLYSVLKDDGLPVSSNQVSYLYEDRAGKLWAFFFQEGLYYLDRSKDAFLKVNLDKHSLDKLKGADYFRKWMEDKQQPHLHWLFTHYAIEDLHHVYLFDDVHNIMEDYSASGKGKYYVPMIHGGADIVQDANGKMWIIADSLLSYFNWNTKSFQPVFVLPDSSKKYMFSVITPDPADGDVLWLNTWIPNATEESTPSKFIRFNIMECVQKTNFSMQILKQILMSQLEK
jgi:ligand-binding sensor domain-containing protein